MWGNKSKNECVEANGTTMPNGSTKSKKNKQISKEEKCLAEFKSRVDDIIKPHHDDYYLRKWLKARNFDVDKAETMYRASMVFREKMGSNKILLEYQPPKVLKEYLTGGFCGFDKEGSPIRIELFGYLDMKGIMYSSRKVDLEKTKILQCEKTVKDWETQSEKLGKRVDGLTVIFDMDKVSTKSMWRPGLQMYLHLVKVLEDNYPEMMKKMFVVNAPRIFPILWKICRPLISEDMKNKIHVLGSDYKSTLLKYIEVDQLPQFLGGILTDPDGNPRCVTKVCQGGEVPQEYYLSHGGETGDLMDTTIIAKGDTFTMEVPVERPGAILRWEYRTEDYDISFGIKLRQSDGSVTEVLPPKRLTSHMIPEDGSIVCEQAGIYEVTWDNSYSWTRAKTLYHVIEVLMTDADTDDEVNAAAGGNWTRLVKDMTITHL